MRIFRLLLTLLIIGSAVNLCVAQKDTVVAHSAKVKRQFYLSPYAGIMAAYAPINNHSAINYSLSLGFIYKKQFLLAVVGNWIRFSNDKPATNTNFTFAYAGINWEYHIASSKNFHVSFGCMAGRASMKYRNPVINNGIRFWTKDGEPAMIFEPNLGFNFKLSKSFQFQARTSYRLSGDVSGTYVEGSLLNGYNAGGGIFFTGL